MKVGSGSFLSYMFNLDGARTPWLYPRWYLNSNFLIFLLFNQNKTKTFFSDSSLDVMRIATKKNEENFPSNPELSIIFTSLQFSWYSMGRERFFFLNPIKKMTRKSWNEYFFWWGWTQFSKCKKWLWVTLISQTLMNKMKGIYWSKNEQFLSLKWLYCFKIPTLDLSFIESYFQSLYKQKG